MAKKATTVSKKIAPEPSKAPVSTPVRNSAIPKVAAKKSIPVISQDQIAMRAYEIHLSGTGGSESDNWFRAERELKGAL